jgi:hypothetical protein
MYPSALSVESLYRSVEACKKVSTATQVGMSEFELPVVQSERHMESLRVSGELCES